MKRILIDTNDTTRKWIINLRKDGQITRMKEIKNPNYGVNIPKSHVASSKEETK